jgi:hypothetical protein
MRMGTQKGSTILGSFVDSAKRVSNPETLRGLTALYHRGKTKLYCPTHGLQPVMEVTESKELVNMTAVVVRLECQCDRISAINHRPSYGGGNGN